LLVFALSFTGAENGRLAVARIPFILSKWIVVKNSPINWKSKEFLSNLCSEILEEKAKYSSRSKFSSQNKADSRFESKDAYHDKRNAAEELMIVSSEKVKASPRGEDTSVTDIDLVTFCLLCNRLILLLE
jgi:hypothetical protein